MAMKKAEREALQREQLAAKKAFEQEITGGKYRFIAGVDEVGRGPLAGPVVAAAVVLPADFDVLGVDDSKKLSEKKREQLFELILEKAVCYGIAEKDNHVIDEINILQATKLAMTEAIEKADAMLQEKLGEKIDFVLFDAMEIKAVDKPQVSLIKGDLSFTIFWSLLKLMSMESVMPSNYLILCHPFSCLQSFPASGSFPMSWLFTSGGQSTGVLELQLQCQSFQ